VLKARLTHLRANKTKGLNTRMASHVTKKQLSPIRGSRGCRRLINSLLIIGTSRLPRQERTSSARDGERLQEIEKENEGNDVAVVAKLMVIPLR
jgi:hypothetical protein